MALSRVKGVNKKYLANDAGFKELGQSAAMQSAMMESARNVAASAGSVGKSQYGAKPATVTVGWDNEKRAGAVAYESKHHLGDWRDTILSGLLRQWQDGAVDDE